MTTRLLAFAVILGGTLTLGLTMSAPATEAAKPVDCYEFVTDIDVLMAHVDDVFYGIPKEVEKKKFKNVRRSAQVLEEFGNLFGHVKEYKGNEKWTKYLGAMGAGLKKLAVAAKKKDASAVEALYKEVEATCDGCHEDIRDA